MPEVQMTREEAFAYVEEVSRLPEYRIDLERLNAALDVVEGEIERYRDAVDPGWTLAPMAASAPFGLVSGGGIPLAVMALVIGLHEAKKAIHEQMDPDLFASPLTKREAENTIRRIKGIIPSFASTETAAANLNKFVKETEPGAGEQKPEVIDALVVLRVSSPDEYQELLPQVVERFSSSAQPVNRDQLDGLIFDITGGGGAELLRSTDPRGPVADFLTSPGEVGAPTPPPLPRDAVFAGPTHIGVPSGYSIPRQGEDVSDRAFRRAQGQPDRIEPRYRAGDQDRFSYASTAEIRRQQKELERAGLLKPGSYASGFWDQASSDALFEAMGYANRGGSSYEDVIEQLKSIPRPAEERPRFIPPPEVKRDPAFIDQSVKAAFRGTLGREPSDAELAEFAAYLRSKYAAAHDVAVDMARAEFDAENPQEAEGPAYGGGVGGLGVPASDTTVGSFTAVNPAAEFNRFFDKRLGPEREFIEGQAETAENMNSVFASLRTLSSLVGGR